MYEEVCQFDLKMLSLQYVVLSQVRLFEMDEEMFDLPESIGN
jgi:hypothetical protein